MNNQELIEFVANKVYELYEKNEEKYGNDIVLPTIVAQMAVHATLQTLEKLGVLNLPKD